MMWTETSHDHLVVKGGDGVSKVRVVQHDSNNFVYSGVDVTVPDDNDVFKVFYETSKVGAVLKICFEDTYGSWHPKDDDGNFETLTNFAPQTRYPPIPRQDVEIDGGAQTVDLSTHFFDPDDDTLTYTAQPADTTKATTSVSGSTLTITPVATGVTTVTVTASDNTDNVQASFTVVVYDPPPLRTTTERSGIVDPDEETSVTAGSLTVIFPSGSRTEYFQARVDPESDDCGTEAPENNEYLCLSVDLFDLSAMAIDEGLDQEGKMVLTLDQNQATAVETAITAETFSLYKGDGTANSWTEIMKCPDPVGTSECYTFETDGSGGTIEVVNIRGFSDFTTSIPASEPEPETPDPPERPASTPTPTRSGGGSSSEVTPPRTNQRPRLDIDDDSLRYRENDTEPVATFDGSDPDDDDLSWHVDGYDSKSFKISDEGVLSFRTAPDFENPGDRDENNRYEIRVRVADDGSPSRSDSQDVRIRVTNQNELNAIVGNTEVSIPEGQTGLLAQYQVEDPENDAIAWSLGGPDGSNFQIDQEGNLSLESVLDFESPASAADTNVHTVTIVAVDDGSPQVSSQLNVAVTVTPQNELGAISGDTEVSTPEGHTGLLAQYQVEDPENDTIAWSLGGPDGSNFQIDQEGTLSLESALDFETPASAAETNVHSLTIIAVDDGSPQMSSELNVAVTVTPKNELGAISGDTEVSTPEGHTGLLAQYQVEDPENDTIAWSVSGPDAANFQIDQEGNLSLESVLDFESPASAAETNVHSLTITAVDDGSPQMSSELNVAVTVSNVNETPVSAEIPGIELTIGDSPASLHLDEYITDPDGDPLTYSIDGLADSTVASATLDGNTLSISPVGAGSLSFDVSGADAGGLSASATVNVTVVDPTPVTVPDLDPKSVRALDSTQDYDEIVRPIVTRYSYPGYSLVQKVTPDSAPFPAVEEAATLSTDPAPGPITTISLRRLPASTPAPTVTAPAPAPTPTAVPTPIRTSESRPTPAAQPTQPASQAPVSPATRQPTVVPVERAPVSPRATATPAAEPTATAAEDKPRSKLPLWLIILLIMLALLVIASMPLWIVNLLIVAALVALAMALASLPIWLIILVAIACLIVVALIALVYGIVTKGW